MSTDFRVTFAKMDTQAIIGLEELAALLHRTTGAVVVLEQRGRLPQRAFPGERKLCWFVGDIREWLAATRAAPQVQDSVSASSSPLDRAQDVRPCRIGRPRAQV